MIDRSIKTLLSTAADLIEPEGRWTQRTWGSNETCMCIEGAIYAAAGSYPADGWTAAWGDARRACDFLEKYLPPKPGKNPLAAWNDAPDRTQEQVVAKLREVATLVPEVQ